MVEPCIMEAIRVPAESFYINPSAHGWDTRQGSKKTAGTWLNQILKLSRGSESSDTDGKPNSFHLQSSWKKNALDGLDKFHRDRLNLYRQKKRCLRNQRTQTEMVEPCITEAIRVPAESFYINPPAHGWDTRQGSKRTAGTWLNQILKLSRGSESLDTGGKPNSFHLQSSWKKNALDGLDKFHRDRLNLYRQKKRCLRNQRTQTEMVEPCIMEAIRVPAESFYINPPAHGWDTRQGSKRTAGTWLNQILKLSRGSESLDTGGKPNSFHLQSSWKKNALDGLDKFHRDRLNLYRQKKRCLRNQRTQTEMVEPCIMEAIRVPAESFYINPPAHGWDTRQGSKRTAGTWLNQILKLSRGSESLDTGGKPNSFHLQSSWKKNALDGLDKFHRDRLNLYRQKKRCLRNQRTQTEMVEPCITEAIRVPAESFYINPPAHGWDTRQGSKRTAGTWLNQILKLSRGSESLDTGGKPNSFHLQSSWKENAIDGQDKFHRDRLNLYHQKIRCLRNQRTQTEMVEPCITEAIRVPAESFYINPSTHGWDTRQGSKKTAGTWLIQIWNYQEVQKVWTQMENPIPPTYRAAGRRTH